MRSVWTWVAVSIALSGGAYAHGQAATLETLRQKVARNEALIDSIKLDYTVRIVRTQPRPQLSGMRSAGRAYSHYAVTWARSGPRQYTDVQYFYGPDEPANFTRTAFDDNAAAYMSSSQPQHVVVEPAWQSDWYHVLMAKLRMRPFEDKQWLSEALTPAYATLHSEMESVDGRSAHVVDLVRPDRLPSVLRVWIDEESAIPIRTCYYDEHPDAPQPGLIVEVRGITPYRLPNGGWIPIAGVRTITGAEHVTVDVNSITTDVPESLFTLDPPVGGTVYNALTHLAGAVGGTTKTYDEIVSGGGRFIAGAVTDAEGMPLGGVVVSPTSVATKQPDGRTRTRLLQQYERTCAVTDSQGRFALECAEDNEYRLAFYLPDFIEGRADVVPSAAGNLKIVLEKGGAVSGRVLFASGGEKVPVAGASIHLSSTYRQALTGVQGSLKVGVTDEQGRFELTGLTVRMRDVRAPSSEPTRYVQEGWEIRCGPASQTVTFDGPGDHQEIELLIQPDVRAAAPLIGKALPDLAGLGLDVAADDIEGRRVLICFFDMEQRPARRSVLQLAEQAETLAGKGVVMLAVHEQGVDAADLQAWADESGVTFPIGAIAGDPEVLKYTWAVRSLPWLILTDTEHRVTAEGPSLPHLDEMLLQ